MAEQSNPQRRRAAHARAPEPPSGYGASARTGPAGPGRPYPDAGQPGWPPPGGDYPSWPAGAGDPDWVPGADHPSWPAGADGPDWPQPGTDYSGWPAGDPGYGWSPDDGGASRPRLEPAVVQHHPQGWQTPAPVPATRYEYPYPAVPSGGAHASTERWSAQLARTRDTATQTYYELAFGDGRLQVMLTEPPAASQEWGTGPHARPVAVLPASGYQAQPAQWEAADPRDAGSVRVAERILSDADQQAAEIRREASAQAEAIREAAQREAAETRAQATAQADVIREAAEREAAEGRREAEAQAAAVREAAVREAAELRARLNSMVGELTRATTVVTESLSAPAMPTAAPAPPGAGPVLPGAVPAPPETRPARPDTKPRTRPMAPARPAKPARPATTPIKKPQKRSRQQQAMRVVTAGTAALLSIAAIGAITYTGIHGFSFFVFREGGQGETPGNFTDADFLARQAAAQHHDSAPKGRHLKTSHGTVEVHHR